MLGLLTYPIIIEPFFTLEEQRYLWWMSYAAVLIMTFLCIPAKTTDTCDPGEDMFRKNGIEPFKNKRNCFILSFSSCFVLLAVTNFLTLDLAAIPFIWILPLSIYLLTFVLVFKKKPFAPAWIDWLFPLAVSTGIFFCLTDVLGLTNRIIVFLPLQLLILFVICLKCTSRMIELKPKNTDALSSFYLAIAAGGFAASVIVSIALPVISNTLIEYPICLFLASLALCVAGQKTSERPRFKWALFFAIPLFILVTALPWALNHYFNAPLIYILLSIFIPLLFGVLISSKNRYKLTFILFLFLFFLLNIESVSFSLSGISRFRNYYGIYTIWDIENERTLQHGTTCHGRQYLEGPMSKMPMAHLHIETPVGEIFGNDYLGFKKISMIGLGAGSLAAYLRDGQDLTIYELDPDSLTIARKYFSYLDLPEKRGASVSFVFGDGRLSLSREKDGLYDSLVIDAFNSGAIPFHLLTLEAIDEYMRVLKPDGILFVHISNRILDLSPSLYAVAEILDLYVCEKENSADDYSDADPSDWMAFTRDYSRYESLVDELGWNTYELEEKDRRRAWTDQYVDLLGAISW
ncbi:spermidine synthase [Candidatus Omnitrophota bacterium]